MRPYEEVVVEDAGTGFSACLVVEASDRPLAFGGTRVDLSATRDEVLELADNMALKLAAHGSPVGAAKAGLRASPDDPRLGELLVEFAEACRDLLSSTTVLGKDMGAQQWMLDEIYAHLGQPQLGIVQRRCDHAHVPDRLGDLTGYIARMTGKGVFWSIEQALGGCVRGARVLIQGFGVVGSGLAWHLQQAGAHIVGVSDRDKAIVNGAGLSVDGLLAAKDHSGLLSPSRLAAASFPHRTTARDDLCVQRADVLVLAAGSYTVDGALAAQIDAAVVAEGANLALTASARQVLHDNAVRVVPDVVANSASAALVGHQIAAGNTIPADTLWAGIEEAIRYGTDEVDRLSRELGIDSKAAFRQAMSGDRERAITGSAGHGHV